jgi:HAD superfamily hydrolase (TIGR01544 family)
MKGNNMPYIISKEKLNKFNNLNNYFVITDFDRTLTTAESEPTMGVIPQYLGGECLEKRTKIYEHYRPLELDYTIEENKKQQIMKEWAKESFTLLTKYITKEGIENALLDANLYLRDGAKEFLQEMNNNDVPVIIMSSGIGNIVKDFLEKENCMFNNIKIVSNFFEFNNGITTINMNNIMATSNKEYIRIPEKIRNQIEEREKALVFGDLIEDIKMIDKEKLQNTLTFGFLDENIEQNLERYKENFDIILTGNDNFNTVRKILKNKEENNGNKLV